MAKIHWAEIKGFMREHRPICGARTAKYASMARLEKDRVKVNCLHCLRILKKIAETCPLPGCTEIDEGCNGCPDYA